MLHPSILWKLLKRKAYYISELTSALGNLFGFLPSGSRKKCHESVKNLFIFFLGEQIQYVARAQKTYLLSSNPQIILLGRKQAETSYIVETFKKWKQT